jgi:hypothetical protein
MNPCPPCRRLRSELAETVNRAQRGAGSVSAYKFAERGVYGFRNILCTFGNDLTA